MVLIFDANADPHNTPESQGPRWRYTNTASTENNTTKAVKETRGETNRHETLIETQVPDHAATTGPRKRGNHHSPMKHSKRRMLGPMVKAGLPAHYLVEVNSRGNARGEQKCEKSRRLHSAEM
jgi:hypothetical protein